jgi:lipopolysaccharide assembly outer membrane protein LptD (OstA)
MRIKGRSVFLISFGSKIFRIFSSTKLLSKLVKISPVLIVCVCTLFQHDIVGSTPSNYELDTTVRNTNPESDTAALIIKTDSVVLNSDTTIDTESLKSKVKYHARDSIATDLIDEVVHLYGDATVDYEDLHLKANYITIDFNKKELYAEGSTDSAGALIGKPEFSQAGQNFKSNAIRYNFNSKKGKIAYVITKEGEGYIHGDVVKKDPENNFFIRNGQYTTCDLDTPHYSIASKKLKVIANNKIVTGPAFLTIETVPTPLLIPFGFFPNRKGRSSGLIFPSIGESANRGFFLQHLGYYFGINDYVNLAITSDIYSKGSYDIFGSSVYAKRYKYRGNLQISYLYTVTSEPELPDYSTRKDYQFRWNHAQDPKARPSSNFNADVNVLTSKYYSNIVTSNINNFLSNTFQSNIQYTKTWSDRINFTGGLRHDQNTLTHDVNVHAPDVSFGVSRIYPFKKKETAGSEKWYEKIGTNYSMTATNFISTKDSLLFRKESLDNLKNGVQHSIPISTTFKVLSYFNVTPSVNYSERWYFKTVRYEWNNDLNKTDTIIDHGFKAARDYSASASLNTRMYGMYLFPKGPVSAVRHVFSPTLGFSYRPDFSRPSYGYYKSYVDTDTITHTYSIFDNTVYGGPGSGRYGSLNLNLGNNLEMKVRTNSDTGSTEKKIKLLENLNFGASYNLFADSMKLSTISVRGNTTLFDKISLSFGGTYDPYAFDENNRDYNRYQYSVNKKLVRLTNASASLNFSLNSSRKEKTSAKYSSSQLMEINQHPEDYIDFTVPYNLNVSYTYAYSKTGALFPTTTQSVSTNGDLNVTSRWKIGFTSWYDITNSKITSFSVNISRDLHCWEMRLNWIPFGFQESYFFQINVKSSILQDLKLIQRKDFYDQ